MGSTGEPLAERGREMNIDLPTHLKGSRCIMCALDARSVEASFNHLTLGPLCRSHFTEELRGFLDFKRKVPPAAGFPEGRAE